MAKVKDSQNKSEWHGLFCEFTRCKESYMLMVNRLFQNSRQIIHLSCCTFHLRFAIHSSFA